jgi:hypothetical protein
MGRSTILSYPLLLVFPLPKLKHEQYIYSLKSMVCPSSTSLDVYGMTSKVIITII